MQRVINYAFQASKEIKTKTKISSGTVSVSYAAIEIIKEKIAHLADKKILLFGTGKFGNNVAVNLSTYLPDASLHFCNRTDEKAILLAEKCNAAFVPFNDLSEAVNDTDILIVSTSSESYSVLPSFFTNEKERLVLDLSIPQNVDPAIKNIPGIQLMNVDEISVILDKTIDKRKAEIPQALQVIAETISELKDWYESQAHNPVLRKIKSQLNELAGDEITMCNKQRIQKTVSFLAIQLKKESNKGCQYINALNNYFLPDYEATA